MTQADYPSGLRELPFVEAYHRTTLRKPQVVSDTILRALVTAGQDDRLTLLAALGGELAEASRRLVAVHDALFDRRYPIAVRLAGGLPGVEEWRAFADRAATVPPEAMLHDLGLGEEALAAAEKLRGQPALTWVDALVAAAETGNVMSLLTGADAHGYRPPEDVWVGSSGDSGDGPDRALTLNIDDAAALADTTADMVSIARGFLGAYLSARVGAGRRDEA